MAHPITGAPEQISLSATPPHPVSRLRVYAMLVLGILCIGFSAVFVRWSNVPGTVSAFYRVLIATVVLAVPFARGAGRGLVPRDPRAWALAAAAGIFFALDNGFWNTSLFLTNAANATLLGNDAPIIVGLGALLLFRERLGPVYWLGLTIALTGMGIIVGGDILSHSTLGAGDLLALAGGAAYGCYLLTTQRLRARMNTLSTLWIGGTIAAVLLLPVNVAAHDPLWGFSLQSYLALLALGVVSQVAGWLAITYALGHLPASIVSPTLLGQPIITAFLAVPLLGEPLAARQVVGGVVALAGIYLVNRRQSAAPAS